VSVRTPGVGSSEFIFYDSKSKGWFVVKKFIALLFVGAFIAASVIGCTPASSKSGGTPATTAAAPK